MLKTLSLCLVFSCVFKTLSLARNREGSTMGVLSVEQTLRFFASTFLSFPAIQDMFLIGNPSDSALGSCIHGSNDFENCLVIELHDAAEDEAALFAGEFILCFCSNSPNPQVQLSMMARM